MTDATFYEKRKSGGKGVYVGTYGPQEPGYYKAHPPWVKKAVLRAAAGAEMTIRDISRQFGVNERTISRWSREAGIKPRLNPGQKSDAERAGIYHDYCHSAMPVADIKRKYGMSEHALPRFVAETWAQQNGLPFRLRLRGGAIHIGMSRSGSRPVAWGPWQRTGRAA